MQGYKVKERTAIVPPVSKLSGHPDFNSRCVYIKYVIGWENLLKAVVMNEVNVYVSHFKADNIFIQI
jgi:hypothetical protein